MANRRFGGPQKLGGFGQQFHGNKVNPWQGGAAPNNSGNSGLLSQLSAPHAQLALALTSLLQPQQQANSNPPSLLSLPTSPAFGHQDNFGSHNRFGNRGGRDFRRPEPYKFGHNRSGNAAWRDNSTRPTGSYGKSGKGGGGGRFGGNKDRKSPPKGGKANKAKFVAKPKNLNDSSKKDEKPEPVDSSVEESRDEDSIEGGEKKRDWKQEKNGEGEEMDTTGDNEEEEEEEDQDQEPKKEERKPREGRYVDVPTSLLHCFVCNKSMWDGESFQNHIRGKAHKQMMDSLGQSFQITVNILRENMRLVEEKKMIELERVHRNNRSYHRHMQEPQSHCNMCDLKFLGKIISHRKTDGHQRLKRFLHPKCEYCSQEFPSRMEWVDHRFTPDHLRKIKEILETRTKPEDGAPIIEEENPDIDNDPLLDESLQTENENPVLELSDDLKDLQNRIPAYKPQRPIAQQTVNPASGFYCDICVRFMTSESAAQEHLKSEIHYYSFVDAAKKKYKRITDEEKAAERNAKKRKAEESEEGTKKAKNDPENAEGGEDKGGEMYDPEEACQENDASIDNATLDDEFAEVDRLIKTVQEDEIKEEKKEVDTVEETKPEVTSPRARRAGTAATSTPNVPTPAATSVTNTVKNGAGPKSKTRRGGK